ncbi:unnamed protein product [Rhizoctonia solani]|uniref:Transmembrane protein n=1 Tax=Rhizoctonia solani TaxID=456999 RepID=A0A8H3BAP5_9AGAM|nr:unnamed protein product [Rhizoctonia solani]
MSSFLRIAGAAALVLSLGLVARALPVANILTINNIDPLVHTDAISCALNKLIVDAQIVAKLQECLNAGTAADLKVCVDLCVTVIKACADELLKIGTGVAVDAQVKADIVFCIAAFITLVVKVCLQLTLKFGVAVVATIFTDLDACIKHLLVTLNICIDGVIELVVKAIADVTLGLLVQVQLSACVSVFAAVTSN